MLALYILLGLLAFILLLFLLVLFIPAYGRVRYDGELKATIRVLGIPITLLPTDKEPTDISSAKKRPKESKPSKVKELKRQLAQSFREDGVAATLDYIGTLAEAVGKAVGRALGSIVVDKLKLDMVIVGADAAECAVRYGQVCSVLYPSLTAISDVMRVRCRDIRVEPNFLAQKSDVRFDIRFHVWVFRLVGAGLALLVRIVLADQTVENNPTKEVNDHGKS